MTRGSRHRAVLSMAFSAAALLVFAGPTSAAQDCLQWIPPLLHNTSGNPSSVPTNPRILGTDIMYWNGEPYLVANNGNNLYMWNVDSPQDPGPKTESFFNAGVLGDRDYNLFNFSVCDDCQFGVASFEQLGAVLFDFGTGQSPGFEANPRQYQSAQSKGAFTFKHYGQQYLLINGMPNGDPGTPAPATLFMFNGLDTSEIVRLARVDAGANVMTVLGGNYIASASGTFIYVFDANLQGHIFKLIGSGANLTLQYMGSPFIAGYVQARGFRVDATGTYAAAVWGTNAAIYDISIPGQPFVLIQWTPDAQNQMTSVAIGYPYLWMARKASQVARTYDITNPGAPIALDQGFWDPLLAWNAYGSLHDYDAVFSPDTSTLYDGRYSVLEMISFASCGDITPIADLSLSPQPAFPGDTVTVTNTSAGGWTRAAIWVTDGIGAIVAGSTTLSPDTPSFINYALSASLGTGDSYTAHVAVENDDHPFNPGAPGEQLKDVAISIDRAPDATISVSPETVLTGEAVTLTATAEGHPTSYDWMISPPGQGQPFSASGASTQVTLNQSGTWTFDLTVHYLHTAVGGGLYQATAETQFFVTSVSAAFTISPATPVTSLPITLDASPSLPTSGVTMGYDWDVSGATIYTNCPAAQVCVIPADALNPGQHQITLTVTNLDNGVDQSVAVENVNVADGSVNPDFSWIPTSPEIGQQVLFTISGVYAEIEQATWNFGGSGCSGFTQTTVCTPSLFNDCKSQAYKYASGGSKTVTLTVMVGGQTFTATPKTITVRNTGACVGGECSYEVTATPTSFGAAGGTGNVSVSTTPACIWSASRIGSWISFTGNTSGSGSSNLPFSVAANPGSDRTGSISVSEQSIVITQAGAGCTFALSPGLAYVPPSGGTDTFQVQTGAGCPWTATSTASWLRVTSGASGEGGGTVGWVADANGTVGSRTGTILVAGQVFTVQQSSPSTPTDFTVSNSSPQIGETVLLTVTGGEPVSWDMGGLNCDGLGPTIDCEGDVESCMSLTWSWAEPGLKSVQLFGTHGSMTRVVDVLATGSCAPCTDLGPPTAAISISPNPAGIGEVVTFNDASTGDPTGWSWSVTLGGSVVATSTQRSFALVLDRTANYMVNLTASNCRGFSSTTASLTVTDQPSVNERVIAGAAHLDGLFDTSWRTDLAVFNPSTSPVDITLSPDGEPQTASADPVLTFGLAPGATRLLEDVLGTPPLGDGGPRKSSLILTWDGGGSAAPTVAARTFNQTPTGSYGQYLPAVTPSPTAPAEQWLTGLADNQTFRTNLLLVNLDDDDATAVAVELLDATGSLIGQISNLTVPGRSSLQLVGLAQQAGIDGQVDLYSARVLAPGAHLSASASVIDNLSGDPVQYLAAHDWPSRLWLPGVAHLTGANGSTWRSDVVVANPGASALSLSMELVPETPLGSTPMLRIELSPGESTRLEDIVGSLVGADAAVKGYLRVTVDAQSPGRPLVSARTFDLSANGTFGQAIPAVTDASSIPPGWRGCLPGFRGSASPSLGYRTNLGLLNTSSSEPAVVNIRLFDTTGSEIATVLAYPVAAASSVQFNLLDAVGLAGSDVVGSATLEVVSGGPVSGYLSVIDNRTQDPILVPATLCGAF